MDWRLDAADACSGSPATPAMLRLPSCRGCANGRAAVSEMRSNLTGRVVDSYTNILTVKLSVSPGRIDEDAWVREAVDRAYGGVPRSDADDHRPTS